MPAQKPAGAAVTKADLKRETSRLDAKIVSEAKRLDAKIDRVILQVVDLQADVRGVKERLQGLATKDDVNRILAAINAFAGRAEKYDKTSILHGQALSEAQATLKDHERRIAAVESR